MDDALRRLERETRDRPADLALGRTYAEALRRAGERQRCFVELSRLSRHGDLDARREVTRWIPWPGTRGRGDSSWRDCEPLRTSGLEYEVGALPSTSGGWSFLTVSDERAILVSRPTSGPTQLLQIRLRGAGLSADWTAGIQGRDLAPFGDDLLVLEGRQLVSYSGQHGHELSRRSLRIPSETYHLHIVADLAVVTELAKRAGSRPCRWHAFPIDPSAGDSAAWQVEAPSGPVGDVRGLLLGVHEVEADGSPVDPAGLPASLDRLPRRHVMELRDPSTGQVVATTTERGRSELLAWDDDGLVLGETRVPRELRSALDAPPVALDGAGLPDGGPRPILAPEGLVHCVFGEEEPFVFVEALDRGTGASRWRTPAGTSVLGSLGVTSGLAAARRTVYVANGDDLGLELRGHDLGTGALLLELRLPYWPYDPSMLLGGTTAPTATPFGGPRLVQLAPIAGGLLILLASTDGPKLIRVR